MAGGEKYEREIAEILERMDREEPAAAKVKRQTHQKVSQGRQSLGDQWNTVRGVGSGFGATAGWTWIAVTIGLGVLGIILRSLFYPLGIICAVLMFLAFFSPLIRRGFGPPPVESSTMWRGKVVDMRPKGFRANLRYQWRRWLSGGR